MFKQSLPGIKAISYVPCRLLSPNILEKYRARVPIGVFAYSKSIEHYGNASCDEARKNKKAYKRMTLGVRSHTLPGPIKTQISR